MFARIKLRCLDHKVPDQGLSALKAAEKVPTAYSDDLPAVVSKVRGMIDDGVLSPDNVDAAVAAIDAVIAKGMAERALQREEISIALHHKELSRKVRMGFTKGILAAAGAEPSAKREASG